MFNICKFSKLCVSNTIRQLHNSGRVSKNISVGNINEQIIEKSKYSLKNSIENLQNETISVLGYGPQGSSQSLNLRDQDLNVNLGLRKGPSWDKALSDGWVENHNLFSIEEATSRGTIIKYLLSDAAQISAWPTVKRNLSEGDCLYFSHGFGYVFNDLTKIYPPEDIDVILVAPKGPGSKVREHFIEKKGINSSYAIAQDYTDRATERCLSLAFAIGSGNVFETTFQKEVYSDLLGERCSLMGGIQGLFQAQYEVLRENGHTPAEAYNETVEEALVSLYPLINENGMDWMFANCSTTAQVGALEWSEKFKDRIKPIIEECYDSVISGNEAKRAIELNTCEDYREKLNTQLKSIQDSELWTISKIIRDMRIEHNYN